LNPLAAPDETTEYMITAIDVNNSCVASDKVIISVVRGLYVPNAFTPNGDGLNDKWQIPGLAVHPDAVVTVYNRWGQVVYQVKDYYNNPWDGKFKGTAQATGTFVYLIKLNDSKNQMLKGTVTIIR
jgi:gliding motility-associated-like protein